MYKPLIDRLPYRKRLVAYEELSQKVSALEQTEVKEELQWLRDLALIPWERLYEGTEIQETQKNKMRALLTGKKGAQNVLVKNIVHSFIGEFFSWREQVAEREKTLLHELVIRCAKIEEAENTVLSIDAFVVCLSDELTKAELRVFFKSLVIAVATMSDR